MLPDVQMKTMIANRRVDLLSLGWSALCSPGAKSRRGLVERELTGLVSSVPALCAWCAGGVGESRADEHFPEERSCMSRSSGLVSAV